MKTRLLGLLLALTLGAFGEDYQQAVDRFSRDVKAHPKAWQSYRGRAQAYLGLSKPKEALTDLSNRGYVHLTMGHQEQAVADMRQALDLSPNTPFREMVMRALREAQE